VPTRIAVAFIAGTIAFWAYTQTLLPGVDLGDTGGFQAAVLWPAVSARQAYPLYYNLARPFVRTVSAADPARGLNLFSAIWAAAAVGLLSYLVAAVTASIPAAIVSALLLAFSYTFWSQAIIAEVYSLHLALVAACLIALHAYARKPGAGRLAIVLVVYAASFGNHLSMILLLVPFAVFVVLTTPAPRTLVRPAIVAMAAAIAAAGALQYWPNLLSVAQSPDGPVRWSDRLAAFWFDTTKADWRETMVLGIGRGQLLDRLAMWEFDARQQFGIVGLAVAAAGAFALWRRARPWAVLVLLAFAINTGFALTYNVGDTHVFFLPGHFLTALCAGVALLWLASRPRLLVVGFLILVSFAFWRGWSTWPAVDRHDDRRGEQVIARLALGVSDPDSMLVTEVNWQLENVLLYVGRHLRPDLTWTRLGDVLPHFPFLVADQQEIGREVILTSDAAARVAAAYGPIVPMASDDSMPAPSLLQQVQRIPRGTPYVLSLLTPPREERLDLGDLQAALASLTGRRASSNGTVPFEVIAGLAGERPSVHQRGERPFTLRFMLADEPFTVRMDSWLPFDTFRRAGFGHVLHGRAHVQILERGVNVVWLGRDGRTPVSVYAASLFAVKPRYRIPAAAAPVLALTRRPEP
jgi:hypothetical protein